MAMGKVATVYFKVLLICGVLALTTPILGGYFAAGQLCFFLGLRALWQSWHGRRQAASKLVCAADHPSGMERDGGALARHIWRPLDVGILLLVATSLAATLLSWLELESSWALSKALRPTWHLVLKWGVLWLTLRAAFLEAAPKDRFVERLGSSLAVWMVLMLIYCLFQRYTGVHWAHGWHGRLPSHQFAYGVYRVSGYMGHPLTLAYNLVVITIGSLGLAEVVRGKWARCAWRLVAFLAVVVLLISGSRFPVLVLAAGLVTSQYKLLKRHLAWGLGLLALAGVALLVEGSALLRMRELFDEQVPFTERFSRVIYWRAYWSAFCERPWAGHGPLALKHALERLYTLYGARDRIFSAHNIILQQLADFGLIGFAGLAALFFGLWRMAKRAALLPGGASIRGLVVAAFVGGMMQNNLRDSEFLYAFWFFTAAIVATSAARVKERE